MLAARWILRPPLGVSLLHALYPYEEVPSPYFSSRPPPMSRMPPRLVICDLAIPRRATPFRSRRTIVPKRGKKESYRPSMSTSDKVTRPSYTRYYPTANREFNGPSGWRKRQTRLRAKRITPIAGYTSSSIWIHGRKTLCVSEMECSVTGMCTFEKCAEVVFPLMVTE